MLNIFTVLAVLAIAAITYYWDGIRRVHFQLMMADRYVERCGGTMDFRTGYEMARLAMDFFLECDQIKFGDPAYSWDRDGAVAIADEDMSCWEG